MNVLQKMALELLLAWVGSCLPAVAQDDFDPPTPPEPYMRYKVKVGTNEPNVAYTSGAGTYTVGSQVWINTSAYNSSYTFSHWLKDGEVYSTSQGFYYTVDATVEFVAVYDFTPIVPDDPSGIYPRKLYLESSMEDACSFNRTSGAKVNEGSSVYLQVYPNTGFEFKGWYENGKLVSENISFYYLMGNEDVTLVAMFEYNPATPDDPNMADDQGSVDNTGNSYTLTYMVDGKTYKTVSVMFGSTITAITAPTKEGYTFSGWSEIPATMPAHNVTVTGTFTVNSYTLTYMVDGTEYKTISVTYGSKITAETAPMREGYTFSGWSEIPATMPAHNVTITGTFTVNSYTLTYMVDGTEYKKVSVNYGSKITAETAPMKEGYTFSGWSNIPATMPAHDVTVTGTFTVNSYTLTYMVDGKEYKTASLTYGSTITAETAPTKEGYTFSGWSNIPSTMPARDVTVTGTFTINSYTLTYIVDGVTYKTASVKYGATITVETAPTKEGYTFSGWSDIPSTMPAHDVTVTGTFSINSYTLTYIVDGVTYKTASLTYGSTIIAENVPTKEGYTFSGWSNIPSTMPAHNVTVTGTFAINNYTLTYMVDGKEYKTVSVTYGSKITAENAPMREGYTFSGWSEIPATMPAHNVTITGTFIINKYKVTFVVDGQVYATTEIEYGADVNPIGEPTKEGYTFNGWQNIPADMPANDVTVTGTFIINKYKVTFVVDGQVYATTEIEYGADVNPIGEPTKEGYTFNGWQNIPADMPAHDITVTGSFTVNQYVVTFMYGDNVLTTIEVTYGEAIELPTSLSSDRYTLIEWLNVPETMPAYDIIIYADYVDGIDTITADSKYARYIQMNGMYTNELKQGLNIIRMKDGTAKKVWVK